MLMFVLPDSLPTFLLTGLVWMTFFILTLVFSTWAFSNGLPSRRDSFALAGIHLIVIIIMYFALGLFMFDQGPGIIFESELLFQFGLQITAIFLAAYRIRRQKLKSVLGEGRTV